MADSKDDYWVCKICPAAEECSEQAFHRAKCWGWTLGDCKTRVYKHLQSSGKHSALSKAERTELTENADYEEIQKNEEEDAPPSWNDDGHVEDDGLPDEEEEPRALVAQPKHKGKDKTNPFQITPHVPSSSAPGSSGDTVTLSVATLDLILDTIERARTGLEHARTILESGAQAFNREKKNLDSASEMISAIKRRRC